MRSQRKRRVGFTLIEVLVVVAIIGIAGAVVVPQMLKAGTLQVQAAARMVIADIIFAQNDAVARQKPRNVVFSTANGQYSVQDQNNATLTDYGRSGGLYTTNFKADSRFSGVTLTSANFGGSAGSPVLTLTFDELGTPSSGGTVVLTSGTLQYTITVQSFTGQVTVAKTGG